ncbi:MAG: integrase core domain-containing protein, partial [Actinobacteria bacterium]|nr:integrase core domain-containing protein [Actinomycetota bacterium]
DWRHHYNQHRPHQSLNYQTPAEYAATCQTTHHTKTP